MMLRTIALLMSFALSPALPAADGPSLTTPQASHFAALALKGIAKEYPNKMDHIMRDAADVQSPRALHPAFYGCFDWHSSVHGHWMLIRLLKKHPDLPEGPAIRTALRANLTKENLADETAYLKQPGRASFERTYGWAWLLKLAEELRGWDDPDGRAWSASLTPLAEAFVQRYLDFLPKQTYPIRTGVHPNTAFGLAFALDYARVVKHEALEKLIVSRARDYFANDTNYPAAWEPGGEDFFSAALMEADLMRRVLPAEEFRTWFRRFLPDIPSSLLTPAIVTDRADPKIVHLDGLNLSRAACLWDIAKVIPEKDPLRQTLTASAGRHAAASLPHVSSGDYAGEHWLASFAVWMLAARDG
ncbi:MAG TPA: DUF2891 domain-containing protein [Verrucomicrobiales bacterium]|nr:DUF2891 domain-containing protein [Verrucomicrobiales bacterium]